MNPPSESQNLAYAIVSILFALSLISERIANMVKLYTPELRMKRPSPAGEKLRERAIIWRALICSWLVCIIAGADFFFLVEHGKLKSPFTSGMPTFDGDFFKSLLGIFLTGIFVSLGSKFWHDVLDIVLQFSNLKKFQASNAEAAIPANTQVQTLSKLGKLTSWLQTIPEYRGYEPDIHSSTVNVLFSQQPAATVTQSLDQNLGSGNYAIKLANIQLHS